MRLSLVSREGAESETVITKLAATPRLYWLGRPSATIACGRSYRLKTRTCRTWRRPHETPSSRCGTFGVAMAKSEESFRCWPSFRNSATGRVVATCSRLCAESCFALNVVGGLGQATGCSSSSFPRHYWCNRCNLHQRGGPCPLRLGRPSIASSTRPNRSS